MNGLRTELPAVAGNAEIAQMTTTLKYAPCGHACWMGKFVKKGGSEYLPKSLLAASSTFGNSFCTKRRLASAA